MVSLPAPPTMESAKLAVAAVNVSLPSPPVIVEAVVVDKAKPAIVTLPVTPDALTVVKAAPPPVKAVGWLPVTVKDFKSASVTPTVRWLVVSVPTEELAIDTVSMPVVVIAAVKAPEVVEAPTVTFIVSVVGVVHKVLVRVVVPPKGNAKVPPEAKPTYVEAVGATVV